MCDCISYNGQVDGQVGTPEVVVMTPAWAGTERNTVCIDSCIVDHIKALWSERVWTYGCCCGHNGKYDRGVIVCPEDHARAQDILQARGAGMNVQSWQLCSQAPDGNKFA